MNCQKNIEVVFKAMAPYIAKYLTEPKGRHICDAVYSIGVRLKSCDDAEEYPTVETDCIVESEDPRQLFYRITKPVNLPFRPRISVRFYLDLVDVKVFCIVLETIVIDEKHLKERTDYLFRGTLEQLREQILGSNFAKTYAKHCFERIKEINKEIEESNAEIRIFDFEKQLDINDFDAVMAHVKTLPRQRVSNLNNGFMAVNIHNALVLINTKEKTCIPLCDKKGRVLFCSIDDIPKDLLDKIRRAEKHLRNWDMGSHSLSLAPFNGGGIAKLTWVITPYYYCPADEDGFGEEEEFEVAITCHINTSGKLVDTPVWQEYIGPRR